MTPEEEEDHDSVMSDDLNPIKESKMNTKPQKSDLPQEETDTKEIGKIETMLRKKPKNNSEETPVVSGTGTMKENATRLIRYVARILKEDPRSTKHKLTYNAVLSAEGKSVKLVERRTLAEAIADIEECLQFHKAANVKLNVNHIKTGIRESVAFTKLIPMIDVKKHKPPMSEGRYYFRLSGNAARFINTLNESRAAKITPCRYGYSLKLV